MIRDRPWTPVLAPEMIARAAARELVAPLSSISWSAISLNGAIASSLISSIALKLILNIFDTWITGHQIILMHCIKSYITFFMTLAIHWNTLIYLNMQFFSKPIHDAMQCLSSILNSLHAHQNTVFKATIINLHSISITVHVQNSAPNFLSVTCLISVATTRYVPYWINCAGMDQLVFGWSCYLLKFDALKYHKQIF